MYNFDHIVNWKLLAGSHDFPGPDGGTCINEAAIIAAGFEYKKVKSAADCPPCFSPVLSAYAIGVNDLLPDSKRQKLMKFVMRLSGSADTPEMELKRKSYIAEMTIRKIVPIALRATGIADLEPYALRCEQEGSVEAAHAAYEAAHAAYEAACAALAARYAYAAYEAALAARYAYAAGAADGAAGAADRAAGAADRAAGAADRAGDDKDVIYDHCINILEGAFNIGKQAEVMDTALVIDRLESIKKYEMQNV